MRQPEYSDEALLGIALLCINRLSDKFIHEKTLFTQVAAQPDIKNFQKVLLGCTSDGTAIQTMGEQRDPIIVVGVLIKCLKDIKFCVMHVAYDELMSMDLKEERKRITAAVRGLLAKLCHQRFALAKALLSMLNRLVSTHPSDHSIGHLAAATAPLLFRLVDSAYMSIRHEEDLRRIKPVVAYMIENVREVFANLVAESAPERPRLSRTTNDTSTSQLPSVMQNRGTGSNSSGSQISSSSSSSPSSSSSSSSSNQFNLKIQTTTVSADDSPSPHGRQGSALGGSWEWSAFQSIIFSHVQGVVSGKSRKDAASGTASSNTTRRKTKQHPVSEQENDNTLNKQGKASSSANVRSSARSNDSEPTKLLHSKINSRLQSRKHMVGDCKHLKSQILNFETDWRAKHDRPPKSSDRGAMQSVYTQYKVLKLNIRDHAATDIQRIARGSLIRLRLSKLSLKMSMMPARGTEPSSVSCSDEGDVVYMDVAAQDTPPPGTPSSGSLPPEVYSKYKELLLQKRELKKRLKRFDNDFGKQTGRAPKKSDKEVMRPMYQRYHEVKKSLDDMKVTVEAAYGPLPAELLDEGGSKQLTLGSSKDISFNAVLAKSADDSDMMRTEGVSQSLSTLQEEKRQLHLNLKSYEKDFVSRNGRPVTRTEDIAPVAQEYQRYKDLKSIIAGAGGVPTLK